LSTWVQVGAVPEGPPASIAPDELPPCPLLDVIPELLVLLLELGTPELLLLEPLLEGTPELVAAPPLDELDELGGGAFPELVVPPPVPPPPLVEPPPLLADWVVLPAFGSVTCAVPP
jgi:hypothetical protein